MLYLYNCATSSFLIQDAAYYKVLYAFVIYKTHSISPLAHVVLITRIFAPYKITIYVLYGSNLTFRFGQERKCQHGEIYFLCLDLVIGQSNSMWWLLTINIWEISLFSLSVTVLVCDICNKLSRSNKVKKLVGKKRIVSTFNDTANGWEGSWNEQKGLLNFC